MLDAFTTGIIGMALILIAFVLDETNGPIDRDSVQYNALNALGAALLLYYAHSIESIPFLVLNSIWLLVAVLKLMKILV